VPGPFKRIVTGHNAGGAAIIVAEGPPPRVQRIGGETGPTFYEVWNTRDAPVKIERLMNEPAEDRLILAPPTNGTRIRVLDIPPENEEMLKQNAEKSREHFAEIGAADASTAATARHPLMHRTETVDYGIVLEGEIWLVMDEGETLCRQGDVIVQCGTNHAWANRSGKNCRIAFILIDGAFAADIK
jgi:hypothetical protein